MKQKGNKNQLQQGDVFFEKINIDPTIKKKCDVKRRGWVIAEGEEHGHAHRIEEIEKAEMFEYYDDYLKEDCLLLRILEDQTEIKHEEHESIFLDRGIYRVGQINEYDPFLELERKVLD